MLLETFGRTKFWIIGCLSNLERDHSGRLRRRRRRCCCCCWLKSPFESTWIRQTNGCKLISNRPCSLDLRVVWVFAIFWLEVSQIVFLSKRFINLSKSESRLRLYSRLISSKKLEQDLNLRHLSLKWPLKLLLIRPRRWWLNGEFIDSW